MSTRRLVRLGAAAVLLLPLLGSVARADGGEAAALARSGVELRRAHRNEEALAAFAKALELSPTAANRAQVALAEQALGRWLEAEKDLDAALASDDHWITKNRASLDEARRVVGQHLAWLTVDVDVESADVQLDGESLARGVEVRVLAGQGVLEVHANGRVPDIRRVVLEPEKHVRLGIVLAPLVAEAPAQVVTAPATPALAAAPEPAAPEVAEPKGSDTSSAHQTRLPVGPIALGIAGVVGIGVGSYFGIVALGEKSDENVHCPANRCDKTALSDYSEAKTSSVVSTVAIGAGAACVAGGLLWWLFGRANKAEDHAAAIVPIVGPGTAGIGVFGRL